MLKWIVIFVGVVALAAGAAAYVAMNGTPPIPTGACPAILSAAPYDANVILYADLTSLRTADISRQFAAMQNMPELAAYRDFVAKTNFHIERDLDHVLLTASAGSNSGSVVLEGRFDQPMINAFAAQFGTMKHYDAGDMYDFHSAGVQGGASMMFLNTSRLALAAGTGAETQILMLADASKGSEPALTDDLCARARRVAGAPFFAVGDIPKLATPQLTAIVAHENPSAAEVIKSLQGWDAAYWVDGDSLRVAFEGEFDSRYEALQARLSLDKLRDSIQKSAASAKAGPMATGPNAQILDELVKNFAFALDGRYVRLGTSIKLSELQKLAASSLPGHHGS
jgi:hypothetical protein